MMYAKLIDYYVGCILHQSNHPNIRCHITRWYDYKACFHNNVRHISSYTLRHNIQKDTLCKNNYNLTIIRNITHVTQISNKYLFYLVYRNLLSIQVHNWNKLHWKRYTLVPDNCLYRVCHKYCHKHQASRILTKINLIMKFFSI